MTDRYIIPSLDRAVRVLELVSRAPDGLSLADLARVTDVPKSTLFRILTTLQHHHLVQWNDAKQRFQLGYYLWELGSGYVERCEPHHLAERHMKAISDATGETVFLAKLETNMVVYLRRVDGTKPLALMRNLSQSTPVYCTASGRALAAFLPENEIDEVLEGQNIIQHTDSTVTDTSILKELLGQVRDKGYAMVDGEYNKDLLYISAPVFDHARRPQAAITIVTLSSQQQDPDLMEKYISLTLEGAEACSRELGYFSK